MNFDYRLDEPDDEYADSCPDCGWIKCKCAARCSECGVTAPSLLARELHPHPLGGKRGDVCGFCRVDIQHAAMAEAC